MKGSKSDPALVEKATKMVADGFRIPSIMAATGLTEAFIRANIKGASNGKHRGLRTLQMFNKYYPKI